MDELFRNDCGLDKEFADARARWQQGEHERAHVRRRAVPDETEEVQRLRQRWSEMQAKWWNHETPMGRRLQQMLADCLRALSPSWCPPTEVDVNASFAAAQRALDAIEKALAAIDEAERLMISDARRPWYFDTVEIPGVDVKLNDELGPGMEMRAPSGADDPALRLLISRDLLKGYLEQVRPKWLAQAAYRRELYERVVVVLRRARVATKVIAWALRGKGYTAEETTDARINSTIEKLKSRHGVSLPTLPQGRKSK